MTEYEQQLLDLALRKDLSKEDKTKQAKELIEKIKNEGGDVNVQLSPYLDNALNLAIPHSSSSVIRAMLDGGINPPRTSRGTWVFSRPVQRTVKPLAFPK